MPNPWTSTKPLLPEPPVSIRVVNHTGTAVRATSGRLGGELTLWLHTEDAPLCVLPGRDVSPVWLIPPAKAV